LCVERVIAVMPQITLYGTELFYANEGSGNPLVFVPALGATHGMFEPQGDALRDTQQMILPDLRGNGKSSRLNGPIGTIQDCPSFA
jgi:pimeloyl-ACP methyl ester carboxylesterase